MLLRLLLCLLITALGSPAAVAECHDAPAMRMTMSAHSGTPMQRQHDAVAPHACVGCIPPEMLRTNALAAPLLVAALPTARALTTRVPDHGTPPALPPPRA